MTVALSCSLGAVAQRKLSYQERDSVVQALTTIWKNGIDEQMVRAGAQKPSDAYLQGLNEALTLSHAGSHYYMGLQDGVVIDTRIAQIEKISGLRIDRKILAKELDKTAMGKSTGFTQTSADAFMNRIVTELSLNENKKLTKAENDSVIKALATVWGTYLKTKTEKASSTADNNEYLKGLNQALTLVKENPEFYHGMQTGIIIDSNVSQLEQNMHTDISRNDLAYAFKRAYSGRGTSFTLTTAEHYMSYISAVLAADEAIKKQSEEFIDSMEVKPGVKKALSGLLWEVVKEGEGPQPMIGVNDVLITYTGSLVNGTVFDNSHAEKPVRFDMSTLIPGFEEGLSIMRPGSTYRFYIPYYLGYGEPGVPGVIPQNSALIFEVNLLEVLPKQ